MRECRDARVRRIVEAVKSRTGEDRAIFDPDWHPKGATGLLPTPKDVREVDACDNVRLVDDCESVGVGVGAGAGGVVGGGAPEEAMLGVGADAGAVAVDDELAMREMRRTCDFIGNMCKHLWKLRTRAHTNCGRSGNRVAAEGHKLAGARPCPGAHDPKEPWKLCGMRRGRAVKGQGVF